MRKLLGLLLILSVFSLPAIAADDAAFTKTFISKAEAIPTALIRMGYMSFGALNLRNLIAETSGIHAQLSNKVAEMNGNGRLSAHWEVVNNVKTVYVNAAWWTKFPEQQTVLALHELLGTAGFIDDQYWISTSLWFLSLPETQSLLTVENKAQIIIWISKNANAHLDKGTQMAGGVVGVGGGGEGGSLYVKMNALKRSLQEIASGSREEGLQDISHYLSSPLTVTWGTAGLRRSK